ncbi:tyrosine-protein kinase receptor Tie-1 isoform X4 [Mobula hypostoma]|uniref:tyrosine-protein kinase receptor Tie-1 isoform X4 n=1 Tax=Mobula hypostoma TaxID=723540 RepID=UPI002FC30605
MLQRRMILFHLYRLALSFHITGAILDVYLITDLNSKNEFPLSCVSGERHPDGLELKMEKDSSIIKVTQNKFHYNRDPKKHNRVLGRCFCKEWEQMGIYYCEARRQMEKTHVVTIINSVKADFYPNRLTTTVNRGETAFLQVQKQNLLNEDVMLKCNGSYVSTIHTNEIKNGTVPLEFENASSSHTCVYSTTVLSGNILQGAFFRLIVRACPDKKWGTSCDKTCPDCLNGGICHEGTGECICGPGYTGENCQFVCEEGKFGRNCQEECTPQKRCSGYRFCLPDPYGCSCAAGWHGKKCNEVCSPNTYGPECRLKCQCQNGAECDRFRGCKCTAGWRGLNCEKSDHIPKILDTFTEVELNLKSSPIMRCSSSAIPLPINGEIQIRKPTNVILKAMKSIMQGNLTTSEFKLPQVSLQDEGVWECGVNTSTGTDSRKFKVIVKVPPTPVNIPSILEKKSKQLKVNPNIENFTGDGPVKSVKLLYKPNDSRTQWSTIVVDTNEPITVMNLKPSTRYLVRVQLTRPGEGGEGPPGPDAILETDCPEPTVVAKIDRVLTKKRDTISVSWNISKDHGNGSGFIVRVTDLENSVKREVRVESFSVRSTEIRNLEPGHRYEVDVIVFYCGSLGRPSEKVLVKVDAATSSVFRRTEPLEKPHRSDQQLLMAIVASVSVTCMTILLALLGLFCIRKTLFHRRRTFTYQSGSGEETVLQFNSGTLTLTRRPKPQPEPLTYPILEWDDIKFEDVIGEGNFGQVIKALIKKDGLKMNAAIKMLKEFASENDHRDFAGELEVLCKLGHHPNIINLLGACENRGYLYIAIEYAPYGNLLDFLRKSRVLETDPVFAREHGTASTLTSQQLLQFASDVTKGMQYLSEKQFIHRDLAARNVLVGENLVAKIADFGLSRGEEVYVKKTMGRLPVRWMAIESLNYSVYTTKSDVWSFGVLLWEIVSLGGTPYCGMTCAELYEKLPQGFRMEKPLNCDDEVYEFMRQCWRDRPHERPTFAQISVQLNRMLEARKAYVNTALFENFTYAGIDATAEEV